MKKYLLSLTAVLLAVAFTAFATSSKRFADKWVRFNGTAATTAEKVFSNYTVLPAMDASQCITTGEVCIFLVVDANLDNVIQESEFLARANVLDSDQDGIISDNANPTTTPTISKNLKSFE